MIIKKYKVGGVYCVTAYEDCTLSINGVVFLSLKRGTQGYFTCPDVSASIECSSSIAEISGPFKYAPLGTSSDGGSELTQSVEGTVYSTDEDAADNSNFTTAIIDGSRIPVGTYTAIELPQRIGYSTYPHSEDLYLIIQEATSVDDDGEDVYTTIAVSDNANAPSYASTATTARWEFTDGFALSGGNIKIIPSPTQEVPSEQYCFGGRCVSTGITGDSIIEFYTRREQWRLCARFEGCYESTIYTPIEHSLDNDIHLSEMEQALIASACNVISYEAIELSDDELAIDLTPTIVPEYQLGDLTELSVTSISITGASDSTIATAEFWLTTGETAPSIIWDESLKWMEGASIGSAPTLEASTAYRFVVRQEADGTQVINLAYSYSQESADDTDEI